MADSPSQNPSLHHLDKLQQPSGDQNKSHCPGFLLHFKVSPFGAFRWLVNSHLVAQLVQGCCCPFELPSGVHGSCATRAARSWTPEWEAAQMHQHMHQQVRIMGGGGSGRGSLLEATGHMAHGEKRWIHHGSIGHKPSSHEQESVSLLPWNYISLGVEMD